jgi:hypothetical protein
MKMDVGISLPKLAIAAIAAIAIAFVVLLAWIGGEQHYGNCLEKVAIEHPLPIATAGSGNEQQAAREDAVSSCSRWP